MNNVTVYKGKALQVAAMLIVTMLIPYIYVYSVYPVYAYMGFPMIKHPSLVYTFISIIFVVFAIFLLPKKIKKPSDVLFIITFLLIYCPSLALLSIVSALDMIYVLFYSFTLYLCLLLLWIISNLHITNLKIKRFPYKFYVTSYFLLVIVSLFFIYYYYGFSFSNLKGLIEVSDLYSIRWEFKDISLQVPSLVKYLFFSSSKVLIPLLLIYGLAKKNLVVILLSIIMQVSIFAVSGHKSVFLGMVLILIVWGGLRNFTSIHTEKIIIYFSLFLIVTFILDLLGFNLLMNVITRRVVIVPGMLTGLYLEYFHYNPHTFLAYSILNDLISTNYVKTPPFIIGEHYFNSERVSANVNYIGSAFAEFGFAGCLIFTSIAGFIYKLLDQVIINESDFKVVLCCVLLPTWVLVDSSLMTAFFTHGLFLTLIFVLFVPKEAIK